MESPDFLKKQNDLHDATRAGRVIERVDEGAQENKSEKGRVIITGGTEGIGRGIAEEFLIRNDNSVAICARTKDKLDAMKHSYRELFAEQIDLSNRRAVKKFAQEAINDLGGLDALILNAAIFDFDFKEAGDTSKEDVAEKMFRVNEVANIALIRESKEALKVSNGSIVFLTTRFGIVENIETASAVGSRSAAAQEDIGQYIKNKQRIHEYLAGFVEDKENAGIFVFSVIPGTVNTPANRRLIELGTPEMSGAKIKERIEKRERDPRLVGMIIAKMTAARKKFNTETRQYDIDIKNGEIVEISNAAIEFEKEQRNISRQTNRGDLSRHRIIHVGDVLGNNDNMFTVFDADDMVSVFPLHDIELWPQDERILDTDRESLIERAKRFYGEEISELTFGQVVQGIKSIESDFNVTEDLVRITRDELWLRSRMGSGSEGNVIK